MDNNFFNIGLGNRYLWVLEDPVPPTMKSEGFLFLPSINIKDELFEATLARYQELSKIKTASFSIEASNLWRYFDKELQEIKCRFNASNEGYKASYYVKRSLDTLKLSLIYAASRFEVRLIPERTGEEEPELWVAGEDMERAIDDIKNQYLPMFDRLTDILDEIKNQPVHVRHRSTREDIKMVIEFGKKHHNLVWASTISKERCMPKCEVCDIIDECCSAGYLERLYTEDLDDIKTSYIRQFIKRGPFPEVYRLTEEGEAFIERP